MTFINNFQKEIWENKYKYKDESYEGFCDRIAKNIFPDDEDKYNRLKESIMSFRTLFGGRINSNIGIDEKGLTLFNCFIETTPKNPDSLEGIFEMVTNYALTLKTEGGVGFCANFFRPSKTIIRKIGVTSPGPIKFLEIFDKVSEVITSGSVSKEDCYQGVPFKNSIRKGATMVTMSIVHPDIEEFITAKSIPNKLTKMNMSVMVTDAFMYAVDNDLDWDLWFPDINCEEYDEIWNGDFESWAERGLPVVVYKTVKAKDLWELLLKSSYCVPGDLELPVYHNNKLSNITVSELHELVKNREEVYAVSVNKDNLKLEKKRITNSICTGDNELLDITTQTNLHYRCTAEHRLFGISAEDPFCEIMAKDLNIGDYISVANRTTLEDLNSSIDDDWEIFTGLVLGDGSVRKGQIRISVHMDQVSEVLPLLERIADRFNKEVKFSYDKRSSNWVELNIYSTDLSSFLENYMYRNKFEGQKTSIKEIPSYLFTTANLNSVRNFLSGYLSADGCINGQKTTYYTKFDHIATGIQRLLLRIGVISRKYEIEHKKLKASGFRVDIDVINSEKLLSEIPKFLIESKINRSLYSQTKNYKAPIKIMLYDETNSFSNKSRLYRENRRTGKKNFPDRYRYLFDSDIVHEKIIDINNIGVMKTYDITVEDNENFICVDGGIYHNCRNEPGILFIDNARRDDNINYLPNCSVLATNPCVAKGTLVATDNGIVPVENISVGDKIQTTLGFDEVREIKTYSNQDIYRVHFSDGFSQDVTKGHIFHTMISGIDSRKRWNNEKRLLDIDDNYFVRKEWYKKYPNLNTKLSRDDGLLVGLYLSDGCYSNNSSFNISTNSKEDNSYIEELFIRVGGKFRIDKSEGNCVRYYLTHNKQYLDNLLETVGINTNGKQIFFEKSLNTNKNFILGLIDGLISSDGNVNNTGNYPQIRFSNTNFDIHTLLKHLMLFIKADYKVYKRKIHHRSEINGRFIKAKKTIYTGVIDNDSILNLYNELKYISHKEKNEKLKKVIKNSQLNGVRWKTQIKNIEYIGKGEVFDLYEPEADDWNHCGYVSRGCGEVVANTGLVEYNGETIETGDVCNLGSLVLPRYYDMETRKFDYDLLREDAFLMTEALDNIIDISDYPIEMYRQAAKLKRKIGVGIVGVGSLLMMMGIKYGSDKSVKLFDKILSVFMNSLYQKSALLAKEKGPFALYSEELLNTGYVKNSKVLTEETIDLIRKYGIRNSALSAIAPTGTLSILAGNMSGGLEPVFSTEFTRWNRVEGKKVDFQYPAIHKGEWFETDYFKKEMIADEEILLSTDGKYRIDKNQGLCKRVTIRDFGYNEALKNDMPITPTATELSVQEHLNILGVFAKNIDLSCSKCVELNTRINTSDGTMKLRDISDNRKEDTFEHVSNIEVSSIDSNVKNINSFYYNGFVEGKKITTDAGIDLNGSNQHNIIVLNEKHELCWKSLDKLSVGDIVPIKLKSDISSNKTISKIIGTSFNKPTNCKPITIPTQLTTDLMWWLGCVYADGNVNDIGVHLTQVGGEVLDKYIEVSKKLFDWQPTIVKDNRRKNLFKISINSKVLSCWMKYINFSKNIISEIVFSAPHLLKKKFVEGITLDGYVTEQVICLKTDKSEDLIKDLQLLCINIGIPTYISSKFNKEYNKYYYNLFVGNKGVNAMANFIFPENYKNEKFMKLYNSKPYNSGSCFGSYGLRIPIDSNFLNKIEDIHKKVTTSTTLYNIFHKILNDARKYKSLTLGQIQTVYSFGGEIPDIFNKSNILFTFIKSIDNTYIETADISVEDTHNYIANGFMSHNTINLPADIPFEAFKNLYGTIHNYGVKGCTTYREGTSVSVLESKREEKDKEIKEQHEEFLDAFKGHENGDIMDEIVKLPEEYPAKGYVIRAQSAKWYLHVAFKDEAKTKPFAIFVNTNNPSPTAITMDAIEKMKELAKSKGLGNGKLEEAERKFAGQKNSVKIARMLGYLFRHNVPMIDIIMALDKVEDAHPGTFVFRIKKFLTQFVIDPVDDLGFVCEQCGSKDIVLQEGCTLCRSCGSSKCS